VATRFEIRGPKGGAEALADQAEAHLRQLMGRAAPLGRSSTTWASRFSQVDGAGGALKALAARPPVAGGRPRAAAIAPRPPDWRHAWAASRRSRPLEDLRRQRRLPEGLEQATAMGFLLSKCCRLLALSPRSQPGCCCWPPMGRSRR